MTRSAPLLAVLLAAAACGPSGKNDNPQAAQSWTTLPYQIGPYEVLFHSSLTPRQQQCLERAVFWHWSMWSTSTRGVLRVGRHRWGRIYLGSAEATVSPIVSTDYPHVAVTGVGDGQAIRVRTIEHACRGLSVAMDMHQDPFLEGPQDYKTNPGRWATLLRNEADVVPNLFPEQQAIEGHQR